MVFKKKYLTTFSQALVTETRDCQNIIGILEPCLPKYGALKQFTNIMM